MKEIIFWIFVSLGFTFNFENKFQIPDHPLYFSYVFSFDKYEKDIIKKEASKASGRFHSYKWPVHTKSSKVNIFFTILNKKNDSPFYQKALIYLFKISPEIFENEEEGC